MFNMGASLAELPSSFREWPKEPQDPEGKVAIIDADLLPYIIGFGVDEFSWFKALDEAAKHYNYDLSKTKECQEAIRRMQWEINRWITGAGCNAARFYLTNSDSNIRNCIAFSYPYKGDRDNDKPPFYQELRDYLTNNYHAVMSDGCEADDLIVQDLYRQHRELEQAGVEIGSNAHKQFSTIIAVSVDKDLKTAVGWHYNPVRQELVWVDKIGSLEAKTEEHKVKNYEQWPLYKGEPVSPDSNLDFDKFVRGKNKGKVKTKRVQRGYRYSHRIVGLEGTGLLFFYSQILTGDAVDCYKGCKGIGAARAYEILQNCKTEEDMYSAVLEQYISTYGSIAKVNNYRGGSAILTAEQIMTEQGRLAFMQTVPNEVWNTDVQLPLGTDARFWEA